MEKGISQLRDALFVKLYSCRHGQVFDAVKSRFAEYPSVALNPPAAGTLRGFLKTLSADK